MEHAFQHNTAILVFVRQAKEEARIKRFASVAGRAVNRRIAELLNDRVIRLAQGTGLPTYVISSDRQVGDHFGARFTHALQTVFNRGHQHIIALGNDCLTLNARHLREATTAVRDHGLVLGPSVDGGAYIIGLDRRCFKSDTFEALPWQQSGLFAALLEYSLQFGKAPYLLTREWDADDPYSFACSLAGLPEWSLIRQCLLTLVSGYSPPNFSISFSKYLDHQGIPSLRGPPRFTS